MKPMNWKTSLSGTPVDLAIAEITYRTPFFSVKRRVGRIGILPPPSPLNDMRSAGPPRISTLGGSKTALAPWRT